MEQTKSQKNTALVAVLGLLAIVGVLSAFALGFYFGGGEDTDVVQQPLTDTAADLEEAVEGTKSSCFVVGERYSHEEEFTYENSNCVCQNGSVVCEGEEVVADEGSDDQPTDTSTTQPTSATKEMTVGVKYWSIDETPKKTFTITVPKDTKMREQGDAQVVVYLDLAPNATLSFTIPHLSLSQRFASVYSINDSKIPNLQKYFMIDQVSPDVYGYSDLITDNGSMCDTPDGLVEPPCGTPALADGLVVRCSWMAGGGSQICDDAMKTMEFVD